MSTNFDSRKDLYNGNLSRYPRTERDFDARSTHSEIPAMKSKMGNYRDRCATEINTKVQCERRKGRRDEKSLYPQEEFESSNEDEGEIYELYKKSKNKLSTIEVVCNQGYRDGRISPNMRHLIMEIIKPKLDSHRKWSDNLLEKNSIRSRAPSIVSKAKSYRSIRSHKSMKSYKSMQSIYRRQNPSDSGESDDFDIQVRRPPTEHYFADSDRDLPKKLQNLDNNQCFRKPSLESIKVLPRKEKSLENNCQKKEHSDNTALVKESSETPQKRLSSGKKKPDKSDTNKSKKKTDKLETNEMIKKLQNAPAVLNRSKKEMEVPQNTNSKKRISNSKYLGQREENANNSQTIFETHLNNSNHDTSQPSFMKRKLFSQSAELLENDPARTIPSPAPQNKMVNMFNKNNDCDKLKKSLSVSHSLKDSVKPLKADTEDVRLHVNGQCRDISKADTTYIGLPRHESTLNAAISYLKPNTNKQKDQSYVNSDSQEANATVIQKSNENKVSNNEFPNTPKASKWLSDGSEDETGDDEVKQVLNGNGIGNTSLETQIQDVRRSVRKNKRPPKLWIDESDHYESCLNSNVETNVRRSVRKNKRPPKLWINERDQYENHLNNNVKTISASNVNPAPKKRKTDSEHLNVSINSRSLRSNQGKKSDSDKVLSNGHSTANNVAPESVPNNYKVINNDLHNNETVSDAIQGRKSLYNIKRLKEIFDSSREYTHTPRHSPRLSCKNKYFQARLYNPKIEDMKVVTVRSRAQFQKVDSDTEVQNIVESEQGTKQTKEESVSNKTIQNLKQKNGTQHTRYDLQKAAPAKVSTTDIKITLSPIPHVKDTDMNLKQVVEKSKYDKAMLKIKSFDQKKSPIKSIVGTGDELKTVDLVISDHIRGSKRGGSSYMGVDVFSDDDELPVNSKTKNDNRRSALERIENHIGSQNEYGTMKVCSTAFFDKTSSSRLIYTNQRQNDGLVSGLFQTSKLREMPKNKIEIKRTLNGDSLSESHLRFNGTSSYKSAKSARFGHCFF